MVGRACHPASVRMYVSSGRCAYLWILSMKRRRRCLPTRRVRPSPIRLSDCVRHRWPNIACCSGRRAFLSERLTQGTAPLTTSTAADRIKNDGSIVGASWKTSVKACARAKPNPCGDALLLSRNSSRQPESERRSACIHPQEHIVTARQCERKTEDMKFMSDRRQRQKSTVKRGGAVIHTFDHMGKRDGDG